MHRRAATSALILPALFATVLTAGGCGRTPAQGPAGGPAQVSAWVHSGQQAERATIKDQVRRFNASQHDVHVNLTVIPEGSYNAQVQAAALAGDLPDALEFDGPYLYNYVWQGRLIPIGGYLPASLKTDLIPSILRQGTYRGKLYSVGVYDSGLGLYARRSMLEAVNARIPKGPADAWTVGEFERLLQRLARRDADGEVLDLKLNYSHEWYTYAFSPPIASSGGALVRGEPPSAEGALNGAAAVAAMEHIRGWIRGGYVDPDVDDNAFIAGRVALSWAGHWEYRRYAAAHGGDLVIVPLPDFGHGTRTAQGSWNWGVTRRSRHPAAAMAFIRFLLRPAEVLRMSNADAAVPGTRTAIARSPLYGPGKPLRLFAAQLLHGFAVPRPRTAAYPVITSAFQRAFDDIRNGGPVKPALDRAAAVIDRDVRDNEGYRR